VTMHDESQDQAYKGWAILELMGHRRLGGFIRQVEMYGSALLRIDVPAGEDEVAATQLYSPGAIYCITPTTEAIARAVAARERPAPVHPWELPAPEPARPLERDEDEYEDDPDEDDVDDQEER
jgi:hypothetical protein